MFKSLGAVGAVGVERKVADGVLLQLADLMAERIALSAMNLRGLTRRISGLQPGGEPSVVKLATSPMMRVLIHTHVST